MARKLIFLIPVLLVTSILALPVQAFAKVEIKRIYYNPKGPDNRTNDSLNREWIQIHNGGTRAVRIWNWRIRDRSGRFFIFPNVSLTPGQDVRVGTGSGWDAFGDPILFYWGSSTYIWNNLGDTATLKRPDGRIVDRCTYRGGSPGYKFC